MVSSLRKLHESIATGPLGRKYSAVLSPMKDDLLLTLLWSQAELQAHTAAGQCRLFSLGSAGSAPSERAHPAPVDPSIKATARWAAQQELVSSAELELRLLSVAGKDGGAGSVAAEIWSGGVRLARRSMAEKIGATVLPGAIFGKPQFSPSGQRVAWVAERADGRAKVSGYWPAPKDEKAKEKDKSEKPPEDTAEDTPPPYGKFEMRRNLGETIGVLGSVGVVWDWGKDELTVLEAATLLPTETLAPSEAAVPAQLQFDGTDDGLIFGCHLLPSRLPGLSACLNRRTALYHYALGDERARCLTDGLYCAMMPRLSPDARTLAFVAVPRPFGSHATCVEVRTMAWPAAGTAAGKEARVVVPKVDGRTPRGEGFGGFCGFHPQLDGLAWLGSALVFPSINDAQLSVWACDDTAPTPAAAPASSPTRWCPPGWTDGSVELLAAGSGAPAVQCLTRAHFRHHHCHHHGASAT